MLKMWIWFEVAKRVVKALWKILTFPLRAVWFLVTLPWRVLRRIL